MPCLFYWKIYRVKSLREKLQLSFVIVFGVVGSVIGIYVAISQLVRDRVLVPT